MVQRGERRRPESNRCNGLLGPLSQTQGVSRESAHPEGPSRRSFPSDQAFEAERPWHGPHPYREDPRLRHQAQPSAANDGSGEGALRSFHDPEVAAQLGPRTHSSDGETRAGQPYISPSPSSKRNARRGHPTTLGARSALPLARGKPDGPRHPRHHSVRSRKRGRQR